MSSTWLVRTRSQLAYMAAFVIAVMAALSMAGCAIPFFPSDGSGVEIEIVGGGTSDEMFNDPVQNAEFYVFQYGDKTITVNNPNSVDVYGDEPLEDGKFYKVVADVTYLNGGVAGYVNYPEVESVSSCEEVSPFDIGLPSIEDGYYGLTLIGDYADGDLFFYEMGIRALWKEGNWLYSYDDVIELDDGASVCCLSGVSQEEIRAGMENGVLSCEDYFVLPNPSSEL